MPYETGGRSDKSGNRYEYNWVIYQLLCLCDEKIDYIIYESLGDDKRNIDLIIEKNGKREFQQCKGRDGDNDSWSYSSLKKHKVINMFVEKIKSDKENYVSLVTPLTFTDLQDLINRANNTSGNPRDFIGQLNKKLNKLFKDICKSFDLEDSNDNDICTAVSYLQRINFHQISEDTLKELINDKIKHLFIDESSKVYDALLSYIINDNVWGRKISVFDINSYCEKNNLIRNDLCNDSSTLSRIQQLNYEFDKSFYSINNTLYKSKECDNCIELLSRDKSIIITGEAGSGKSGCLHNLVDYFKKENIAYLALRLDKRVPNNSSVKWSKDLGFKKSITYSLESIAKDKKSYIVFDQIDSLRWNQQINPESIDVFNELINEVCFINRRNKKTIISIIFACRNYDFDNDVNIKNIIKNSDTMNWKNINITELTKEQAVAIIGNRYCELSKNLKKLLLKPSNLYIWSNLEEKNRHNDFANQIELIKEWIEQICVKASLSKLDSVCIKKIITTIAELCIKKEKTSILLDLVNCPKEYIVFLESNNLLIKDGNFISFSHQSILDSLWTKSIYDEIKKGKSILDIVGNKNCQDFKKRYHLLLLMSFMKENDLEEFIKSGELLIESNEIRDNYKCVFYELLAEVGYIDKYVAKFINEYISNVKIWPTLYNKVIFYHANYIHYLRDKGILEEWSVSDSNKVINLISSMETDIDAEDCEFIKKHMVSKKEEMKDWMKIFKLFNFSSYVKESIELIKRYLSEFPEESLFWFDVDRSVETNLEGTLDILFIRTKYLINNNLDDKSNISLDEAFCINLPPAKDVELLNKYSSIFDLINDNNYLIFHEDDKHIYGSINIFMHFMKKIIEQCAKQNPKTVISFLSKYMGKGDLLINRYILCAMLNMSNSYNDYIINYICSNFDKNIYVRYGFNRRTLEIEALVEKITMNCSYESLKLLENTIIKYIPSDFKKIFEYRKYRDKNNRLILNYTDFWGRIQLKLLSKINKNLINKDITELLSVLKRKYENIALEYENSSQFGSVLSPVHNKELSIFDWDRIINNKKILLRKTENKSVWKDGNFIDSSLDEFASSFGSYAEKNPEIVINYLLNNDVDLLYLNEGFLGISRSKKLSKIDTNILEQLFRKYKTTIVNEKAYSFCEILREVKNVEWSKYVFDLLFQIVNDKNHDQKFIVDEDDPNISNYSSIESNAFNNNRCYALLTIAEVLQNNLYIIPNVKEIIAKLEDENNIILDCMLIELLYVLFEYDDEWAYMHIEKLYIRDFRLLGNRNSILLYKKYSTKHHKLFIPFYKCLLSNDERLTEITQYILINQYLLNNRFRILSHLIIKFKKVNFAITSLVGYSKDANYKKRALKLLMYYLKNTKEETYYCHKLFDDDILDINDDKEYINTIVNTIEGRRNMDSIIGFIHRNSINGLIKYYEIILNCCEKLITNKESDIYYLKEKELIEMLFTLYNEAVESNSEEIKNMCLDMWDKMYFNRNDNTIRLTKSLMHS